MRSRPISITAEKFRDICVDSYVHNLTSEKIAQHVGVSSTSVCRALRVHKLLAASQWAELVEMIATDRSVSPNLVKVAAEFTGVEIPATIENAFRTRQIDKKVEPIEAPARAESSNESVFFTRILEELHETNELLRDLIDATIPKYAEDIRKDMRSYFDGTQKYQRDLETQLVGDLGVAIAQTVNSNCDPIMQLMNRQTDALNGIKCNIRKNNRQEDKP